MQLTLTFRCFWRKEFDAEAMIATLKTQIANFKIPKRVEIVSDLPRNAMGKVQKNILRQQYTG